VPYVVRKGVPDILNRWKTLLKGHRDGTLDPVDETLFRKWAKAIAHLRESPFHPGLASHEIEALTRKVGRKVFQSYLENHTPGAGRMFWVYGPGEGEITVIGLEPHPEERKRGAYERIPLSELPPFVAPPQPKPPKKKNERRKRG
jgi:hypothetical protein